MMMKIRTKKFTIKRGGGKTGIGVSYTGPAGGIKRDVPVIKRAIKNALKPQRH
ncbi:MAG: hypothetical protein HYW05_03115 [Candidatus Diapherotrites archaeon]|nr:hypothetical protein [Candidatus Diapherotrites archaeon]